MDQQYGVITEQNDLGMGFMNLNPSDNQVYAEAVEKKADASQQPINEEKKD